MSNSENIINKIKTEKIAPIPKWRFRIKKWVSWGSYLLFIFIGAISFSIILYAIQQSEFSLFRHLNHSFLEFFMVMLPIIWLILLILFLSASILSAKNTEKGYKLSFGKWLILSTTLSIVLGTLFFISGGADWVESKFANQLEIYESIHEKKMKIWSQPENGNISGEILTYNDTTLELKDFKGNKWTLNLNDAFIAPRVLIENGELIKANGQIISKDTFEVSHLRPWGNQGRGFNKK